MQNKTAVSFLKFTTVLRALIQYQINHLYYT